MSGSPTDTKLHEKVHTEFSGIQKLYADLALDMAKLTIPEGISVSGRILCRERRDETQ